MSETLASAAKLIKSFVPLQKLFNERLEQSISGLGDDRGRVPPPHLHEAMRYALLAGGKRLRPLMVLFSAEACGGNALSCTENRVSGEGDERAWPAALAVEYVHTYSLIHDDLPALDDDDFRRGRPTIHKAFDEATAILAGDALLTDAFTFAAGAPENAAAQCLELALAAGSSGMVAGQAMDMYSEGKPADDVDLLGIHVRKTGRLFIGSCVLGGLSVAANQESLDVLRVYGAAFGLAFQISDDVLDVIGDEKAKGKSSGGDADADKATYVRRYGLEGAKKRTHEAAEEAREAAEYFGERGRILQELALYAAHRDY
ncbi:MAG: polyprenyl synthetase family protein [Gammaproteobacteria bacterium]|nr:polyprenyl synthetase family protein [Gammaproteobacteria bacterium]